MRAQTLLTVMVLVGITMAGCLSDTDDNMNDGPAATDDARFASGKVPVAPDPTIFIGTIVDSHEAPAAEADAPDGAPANPPVNEQGAGHQLSELHAHEHGLELLDHNDLSEGLMSPGSGFGEVHVRGDLAVVTSLLGPRAATLVDVSDPRDMKVLSHIYNLDDNWDGRISDDGRFLFVSCQSSQTFDCTGINPDHVGDVDPADPSAPDLTDGGYPCVINYAVDAPAQCRGGVAAYNITDPTDPTWVRFMPIGWTHNIYTFQHDNGKHYVFNEGLNVAEFDPETGSATIATTPVGGSHDVAVQKHPITGDWLLYTGSQHMSVWNVNDPFHPELIGNVDPAEYESAVPAGWHEQTPMPCLIDGRHITIGGGENTWGGPEPIGVFDTTDPTDPTFLGAWYLPDHEALGRQGTYRYSVHNIDGNCDGQVAVGHYHAGVWVFDISTQERQENPATLGYYLPHERAPALSWTPITGAPIGAMVTADTPNVWTTQWSTDGKTLFVPDMTTGLYALQPTWEYETVAAEPESSL